MKSQRLLQMRAWAACIVVAAAVVGVPAGSALAADLHVPGTYATIQGAVTAADSGDVVVVAAGTYYEAVSVSSTKNITLRGDGACTTILNATPSGSTPLGRPLVVFGTVTVEGFTLTGGFASFQDGGGVWANGSTAFATLTDCVITGNQAHYGGGGLFAANGASLTLDHCTITGNTAINGSGGAFGLLSPATATVTSCILWGNSLPTIDAPSSLATVTYSDIQGGWVDTGNIDANPLFVTVDGCDFHLDCNSPCVGTGLVGNMGALPAVGAGGGTISGNVSAACTGTLEGVIVDLDVDDGADFQTTVTDENGNYSFDLGCGAASAEVSIVVPLGFFAVSPAGGESTISPLTGEDVVDFVLDCLDPEGEARSKGYWKHQASVYENNRGNAQETEDDMETNFPLAMFNHFHNHALAAIAVEGITYMSGPVPVDLTTILQTLKMKSDMLDKARQQYMALLLNMASGKVLYSQEASVDGGTVSQAIQHVAALINNPAGDHELAKDISETLNHGDLVAAGVIDTDTYDTIAYARPNLAQADVPLRVFPNPGGASNYVFSFAVPQTGEATLEIFDVAGRRIATPVSGALEAGRRQLTWDGRTADGRRLGHGVYFARLVTATGAKSVKFVHLAQ